MLRNRTLFISYRRDDSSGWAGRLEADLRSRVGTDVQVFMDVDAIPAGEDFARAIDNAVSRSHALVAIIGPDWITAQDAQGRRRLEDPNDFVRIEIETALRRGIRVIPVLVGDASLPTPDVLPETLRDLTKRQAVKLDHETWSLGLNRLVRALERRTVFDWVKDLGALAAVLVAIVSLSTRFDPLPLGTVSILYLLTWSYDLLLAWLRDKRKALLVVAAALVLTAFAAVSVYRWEPRPDWKIAVTAPKHGDPVGRHATVEGTSRGLKREANVWLVVWHSGSRRFAPEKYPVKVESGGTWSGQVTLGGTEPPLKPEFTIYAIASEDACLEQVSQTYVDTYFDVIEATKPKQYPGTPRLPNIGNAAMDDVAVKRVDSSP